MDKSGNKRIAIVGAGHIGMALLQGLLNDRKIRGSQLIVANSSLEKIAHLKKLNIEITQDNKIAAAKADWIFLAVKPGVVKGVLNEIKNLNKAKLVISMAAGVSTQKLRTLDCQIARIMPNIAISTNQGVIGLFAKHISANQKKELKNLLSNLGFVVELEKEADLNTLTLIAGCGPALTAYFLMLLSSYGQAHGLSENLAAKLALQTFSGTILQLQKNSISAAELMHSVATKGGVTETILTSLGKQNFQKSFNRAMDEGFGRAKSLDNVE